MFFFFFLYFVTFCILSRVVPFFGTLLLTECSQSLHAITD